MANIQKKKGIIGILTGGGDVPGLNPCIKAVVTNTAALTEGNIYGALFMAKHNHATNTMSNQSPLIGVEGWAYIAGVGQAGTCIGGNFAIHNESTGTAISGSVHRVVQLVCDNAAGANKADEATGMCIWNMAGTWDYGIKFVNSGSGFTTGLYVDGCKKSAYFNSDAGAIAAGDAIGVEIAHTGTMSSGEGLIGLQVATTAAGAAGMWSAAIYAKMTEATEKITGYSTVAEFENIISGTEATLHDWAVVVLNAHDDHVGSQSKCAYIWLREYGTNACNAFLRIWDVDCDQAHNSNTIACESADQTSNMRIRCLDNDGNAFWLLATSSAPS